jgi:hypothetical protein
MIRWASLLVLLATISVGRAADLAKLPPNTWVELKYTTLQPSSDPAEKGHFGPQGWNKLVYDPDGKRVLFYDRWIDKKHGGYTIYGNCLFGFDPVQGKLTPIKIDNWTKTEPPGGGYRTPALPENDSEPTPAPRHVYHAFEYVSDLKAVFLCNGANQSVVDKSGKLIGHDACDGAWRFDLPTKKWTQIVSTQRPVNMLDDAMAYCPDTKTIVFTAGTNHQLWLLDPAKGQFRKAKESPPLRGAAGSTIFYDPTQKRMLIAGGGPLEGQFNQAKSPVLRELYAFDPRTETVKKLADCPIPLYEAHLAFDAKRELFLTAAVFWKGDHASGVYAYDPRKDAWQEIKSANAVPASNNWFSWVQLCYDSQHDCLISKVGDKFYAFRYVPPK